MKGFLTRLCITALGLWAAATIVPGIHINSWRSLVVSALLLGIVNAIVRPILVILTFPITLFTLGLFLLVINGLSLKIVAGLVPGFTIAGLAAAVLGAIVVSITGWFASGFIGDSGRFHRIGHVEVHDRRLQ